MKISDIKEIINVCESYAEYHKGYEAGYGFNYIGNLLKELIINKQKPNDTIVKIAEKIKKIKAGRYRLWSIKGATAINTIVGCNKYNNIYAAMKLVEAEGKAMKVNSNGEWSEKGPYWIIL